MKVTSDLVKLFKKDQEKHGTKTAMQNLLWLNADAQMKDLGVKKVKTDYKGEKSK